MHGNKSGQHNELPKREMQVSGRFPMGSAFLSQCDGSHYKNMPIQPIEFCQKNGLNFCESNVIKYVCRHRNKNGASDIKKAIHNLQLLLEMEYKETADEV